jgi:dynein heavy chain, axonemal
VFKVSHTTLIRDIETAI